MIKRTLFLFILLPSFLAAQIPVVSDSVYRTKTLVEDDPVVMMLDSLANLKIFEDNQFPNANHYQNWANYSDTDIPVFPDSVYRQRISRMDDDSPFEYVFNHEVKKFIDLYGVRKRKLTARILGLSQIYFPLFEEQLDRFNMPLELKYLAVIESALNPVASSKVGAKGLWQFMYGTGKVYGLKVSTYVDERFDPYKSTIAACEHLNDLYGIYGSWSLALAAYNSGAGNVNKAIRRSGGAKNFWAIQRYLPRETASYVPAFIAASYVMNYAAEHKINPVDPGILFYEVDTITVKKPLSFAQISEMLNIPMDEIIFLNPSFKQRLIPASAENPYKLRLRKKHIGTFINNEEALYAFRTKEGMASDSLEKLIWKNYRETEFYTVKQGETLASVAKKFNMTVGEVRSLNGLSKKSIRPNKKILVYTKSPKEKGKSEPVSTYIPQTTSKPDSNLQASVHTTGKNSETSHSEKHIKEKPAEKTKTSQESKTKSSQGKSKSSDQKSGGKYTTYTIKSGDNLWDIADRYNITISQLKAANGFQNNSKLTPGQKIKIPK